jgi:hypothetical protein
MANETYSATSGSGARAGIWAPIVTINGVDQTARIVGEIRIDAEEGAARVADLTIRPPAGTVFSIAGWVGKSITIQIADVSSGSPSDLRTLFSGVIDTPSLDLDLRVIALRCSDNYQNAVEAMSAAAIDAATPGGYHSPAVFDAAAGGWMRLQDRLSTMPAACELTTGGSLRVTAWAPKVSPDMEFTAAHLLDGSLAVSLASRHQLVNRVDVAFSYRFPRVKAEGYGLSYNYVDDSTIAQFVLDGNRFLRRDAVEAAIKAAGATIEAISFTDLPNTAIGTWAPNPDADYLLCMGFSAVVSFDYAQMIEEAHAITVRAQNSISAVGDLRESIAGALEGVYPPVVAAEQSILLYANAISGIPPTDTATPLQGFTTAAEVSLTSETNRAAANVAMETLIQVAKVRIHGAHRRNLVTARVPLNPAVDLDQTIDLNVAGLHARGKCFSVAHTMAPESGEAVTELSIAICSVAGTGVTHPETPTTAPTGSTPGSTALASSASADFNYGPTEDHKLTVTFPGVADVERDKALIAIATTYEAPLTEDILEVTL